MSATGPERKRSFGDVAVALAKNPLGMFALFLVATEGLAWYFLGVQKGLLQGSERILLLYFVVGFHVILLFSFIYLVVHHHEKLYAPSEYRDEQHLFKRLSPEDKKQRLEVQAMELPHSLSKGGTALHAERTGATPFRPLTRGEVLMEISLEEDLAFRAIEDELGCTVARQVAIPAEGGGLNLDGAVARGEELVAIEVKYIKDSGIAIFQLEGLLEYLEKLKFDRFRSTSLIVVVVSDAPEGADAAVRTKLDAMVMKAKVPTSVRMYRLNLLKARYGL